MSATAHPWDQRPDEPPESYARFLSYRNLGPGRTLALAEWIHNGAKKGKKKQPSGMWSEESSKSDWRERATAWDIHNLRDHGTELVRLWLGILIKAATKAAEKLADPDCVPKDFAQAVAVVDKLAPYMTPDVLKTLQPPAESTERPKSERSAVE